MPFDLAGWKASFVSAVSMTFGERVVCAGLQGSRARNEARSDSDIDAVLILDNLSADDVSTCRKLFRSLPDSAWICGFVSGKKELAHWDAGELVSFYFDTKPLIGNLDFLLPQIAPAAARRAVHTGACGVYHACCHNSVFGDKAADLRPLYQSAFFILRTKHYAQTGVFIQKSADLMRLLCPEDQKILQIYSEFGSQNFDPADTFCKTEALRVWSGNLITEFSALSHSS